MELDERSWEWTVWMSVHHPSAMLEAQDLSMQVGMNAADDRHFS